MAEQPTEIALQNAIEQVKGVLSARAVLDDEGQLQEVHVLARRTRNAKQIVRDVESVCNAQFGLPIDHRRISVAQIDDEEAADGPSVVRIYPRAVQVNNTGSGLEIKVELISDEGGVYVGVASGAQSAANRLRLVAMATLFAVEEYLGEICSFVLDDVVSFDISRFAGVLAGITLVTPQGEEGLVGSALVKRDLGEAVVKAVLNAINRRLMLITGGAQAS